jgi:hypothetical protein
MLSGLDLLGGTSAQSAKTGLDLLKGIAPAKGEVQVKTGLALLEQQVITEAPTTTAPLVKEPIHPAQAYLEKFTKPPVSELEAGKYEMGPLITAKDTAPAMDTLGRLWNLAQHPYDVVKGSAMFASEIPGFIGGLASAIGQIPIEILKGGSVLDWYNASAKNMQTISGLWHEGVSAPLGKLLETPEKMGEELAQTMFGAEPEVHKDESELIGEIFMVPYTAASAPIHALADSPTWDDHPNVKGLLKFSADALGLVTMGLALKGGPVMAAKNVDSIVKKAEVIDGREKVVDASGLDEVIKTAQKKLLDAEKTQLDLEAAAVKDKLDHEKLVKENLKEKGEEVEAIREGRLKFAEERAKEISEEKVKTGIKLIKKEPEPAKFDTSTTGTVHWDNLLAKGEAEIVRMSPDEYMNRVIDIQGITMEETMRLVPEDLISEYAKRMKGGEKAPLPVLDYIEMSQEGRARMLAAKQIGIEEVPVVVRERPITDLDLQTGLKEPPELSTESSPFRETPERTQAMKELYAERAEAVHSNPELMTNKLLNDVNRWLDGEDIPVEKAKNDLSELAARADELRRMFKNPSDFGHWKDTVSSAASWARKADRSKIERTLPDGTKLYTGLPIDEAVKGLIKATKKGLTIYKELDLASFEKFRGYFRSLPLSKRLDLLASGKLKPVTADITESLSMKLQDIRKEFAADPKKLVKNTDLYRKLEEETITDAEIDTWLALTTKQRLNAGYLYDMAKDPEGLIDNMSVGVVLKDLPPGEVSIKLYSGLPIDETVKQLKSMAKHTAEFMKEFKGSFKEKEFDFAHSVKQVKADTVRSLWDQSETLLNMVRDKYPNEYERVVTRQRSAVTGIGYGKVLYGQAVKEVYGGKTKGMIEAVNAYVLARRFKDIYGYRTEKGYKHQPGYGADQTVTTTAMIEMIKDIPSEAWKELSSKVPEIETLFGKLTPEEMVDVVKAGDAYFEWSRKIVDDLVEVGIKSPEEGALLKAHDFRKFKTILIKKLYDFNYDLNMKGETIKVTGSGVSSLGAGNLKIIEPDSRVVLSEQMARAYGSIAHQRAVLEWKALADKHSDNGFVSVKKQSGWSPMPYMVDGVRKNIYFHPDVVKYLVTRSKDMSPRLAMAVRALTMAPVTRSLAVGTSPIWSTLSGLPMDVMHSLWTARTWEADAKGIKLKATYPFYETKQGKFKKVYSPFAGVDALQIGHDMKRTLGDVYGRGPLTTNLMKHGLVMNFLTQRQNRYMKGVKPPGDWAKMMDLLSYHGLSMELWARVATADRVIRRDAKKLGITYEQALKNDDIMYRAAHVGRDRMDYNQGGWLVKALDQSGMIFLNAAVLGARTFWRQATDNPVDFAFKAAQLGLTATGITAAAWSLYPDTMKDMSDKGSGRDATWPIAPNWLKVKDQDGNDVTFYGKLRMDPNAAFMYKVFENLTRTYMYDKGLIKEEPDYRELVKKLKQLGPVDVRLPPAVQAWHDYVTNYAWWKDRQMYTQMGGKTLDWPESQFEGMYDERVPQIAKDIGKGTKLSPARVAGAGSNVIPYNNEFVWLTGKAYEMAHNDVPKEVRAQHWLITLAETPGFNKVIGITRHGQGRWKVKSDIEDEIELETMVRNSKFDMLATRNAWYGVKNSERLLKFMEEQDFDVYNKMTGDLKFIKDPVVKSLPHRDFWLSMRHSSIKGRAKIWVELLDRSSEGEKAQLLNEMNQVMLIGGIVTPEFMEEVGRVRIQDR